MLENDFFLMEIRINNFRKKFSYLLNVIEEFILKSDRKIIFLNKLSKIMDSSRKKTPIDFFRRNLKK